MVAPNTPLEKRLLACLHDVEDAEMPLDVVDLGVLGPSALDRTTMLLAAALGVRLALVPATLFVLGDQLPLAALLNHWWGYQGIFVATVVSNVLLGIIGWIWFKVRLVDLSKKA